jgi:DNA-binding PadR family transcriptional regulator
MPMLGHEEADKAFQKYGFKAGFLKLIILKLLSKGPRHGYALMKDIEKYTEEEWQPSPGSIYPALKELENEGLITAKVVGRRRLYDITPKGEIVLKGAIEHANIAFRYLQRILDI